MTQHSIISINEWNVYLPEWTERRVRMASSDRGVLRNASRALNALCRVCLTGGDVTLYSFKHARLSEVYEKLSNTKFNNKDGRPTVVCCFCYQRLLRFCTLSMMTRRAEKVFDELFLKGLEATHETIEDLNLGMTQRLSASPMQSFTVGGETPEENSLLTIKQEPISAEVDRIDEEKLDTVEPVMSSFTVRGETPEENSLLTIKQEPISAEVDRIDEEKLDTVEPVMSLICEERLNSDEDMDLDLKAQNTSENTLEISCKKLHEKPPEIAEPKHECNICEQECNSVISLQQHVKLHKKIRSYTCTVCPQQFTKSHQLLTHMIHHSQGQKYACLVCNRQCNTERNLKKHMTVHCDVKVLHTCDVCKKQCDNSWTLKKHMEIHKC